MKLRIYANGLLLNSKQPISIGKRNLGSASLMKSLAGGEAGNVMDYSSMLTVGSLITRRTDQSAISMVPLIFIVSRIRDH